MALAGAVFGRISGARVGRDRARARPAPVARQGAAQLHPEPFRTGRPFRRAAVLAWPVRGRRSALPPGVSDRALSQARALFARDALYNERRALFGCIVILIGTTLVTASLMYLAERHVQPDKLGTIPDAMWWA